MARKVDAPIDWRSQFQASPTLFLVAAIGGGLLIGMATNARKAHKARPAPERKRELQPEPARKSLSWDWSDSIGVIKSVLIGIAITQAKKLVLTQMANHRTAAAEPAHQGTSSDHAKVPPDSTTH